MGWALQEESDPCQDLTDVRWAPYREFGIPDEAEQSYEPPAGLIMIRATAYQKNQGAERIVIYWDREQASPLYTQETLDAAAAEIARQMHGGPADPDDIKLASEVLTAAFMAGMMPQVTE